MHPDHFAAESELVINCALEISFLLKQYKDFLFPSTSLCMFKFILVKMSKTENCFHIIVEISKSSFEMEQIHMKL